MLYRITLSLLMIVLCWTMWGVSELGKGFGSFTKSVPHDNFGTQTLIALVSFAILAIWIPNKIFRTVAAIAFAIPALGAIIMIIIPPVGILTATPAILWYCYIVPRIFKSTEHEGITNRPKNISSTDNQ